MLNAQRFAFIDGLRGIAALSVVYFHLNLAFQSKGQQFPSYIDQLFSLGYLGIQVFFVLSGFVIAYSLRHIKMNLSVFTQFFIRRSLRLDPPYWMIIGFTLFLAWIASLTFKADSSFPFTVSQILYNIFYLPDLMQVPLIIPVAWTLCLEIQFYLVFALLLWIVQRAPIKNFYALILWSGLSLFSILQNTPWAILPLKPVTFIPHWYCFFLGSITCWAMLDEIEKKFLWFNYLMIGIVSFWTFTPHAFIGLGTACLIYLVYLSGGLNNLLKQKFFQYLGQRSYSLYLIHWPISMKLVDISYKLFETKIPLVSLFAFSLLLTLLFSELFYRIIERPSHNFSRNFYNKNLVSKASSPL